MFRLFAGLVFASFIGSAHAGSDRVLVDVSLPFDLSTDALCFKNGDPDLAKTGIPILGSLGVKKGVCQGIAGISAAFRENAEFFPNAPADSAASVARKMTRTLRAKRVGSRERISFRGHSSLAALCRANRMAFLKKSVWLNTDIAVKDIVPIYGSFSRLKKTPLRNFRDPEALRRQLAANLAEALSELREGRYPLLLYFSHVVLVRGYTDSVAADGSRRIELGIYDSNHPDALRTISLPISPDGLPSAENSMIWILTHRA